MLLPTRTSALRSARTEATHGSARTVARVWSVRGRWDALTMAAYLPRSPLSSAVMPAVRLAEMISTVVTKATPRAVAAAVAV